MDIQKKNGGSTAVGEDLDHVPAAPARKPRDQETPEERMAREASERAAHKQFMERHRK